MWGRSPPEIIHERDGPLNDRAQLARPHILSLEDDGCLLEMVARKDVRWLHGMAPHFMLGNRERPRRVHPAGRWLMNPFRIPPH